MPVILLKPFGVRERLYADGRAVCELSRVRLQPSSFTKIWSNLEADDALQYNTVKGCTCPIRGWSMVSALRNGAGEASDAAEALVFIFNDVFLMI